MDSKPLHALLRFVGKAIVAGVTMIAVGMMAGGVASFIDDAVIGSHRLLNVGESTILNLILPLCLIPSFFMFVIVWLMFAILGLPLRSFGRTAFIIPLLACEIYLLWAWIIPADRDVGDPAVRVYSITLPFGALAWWWAWAAISNFRNRRDQKLLADFRLEMGMGQARAIRGY